MNRSQTIDNFIQSLSRIRYLKHVFNPYSDDDVNGGIRRKNLQIYLDNMMEPNPKVLLVGEAPGYNGCRFSGIPFTSERIMMSGIKNHSIFGEQNGYTRSSIGTRLMSEQSATIVWDKLSTLSKLPLLWNAFPLHPFDRNNLQKYRTPTSDELQIGKEFLLDLISLFSIKYIVPVGNNAVNTISNLESINQKNIGNKIRHPANGGKAEFVQGIEEITSFF